MGTIWLHGGTPGYPHVLEVLEAAGVSCSGYQGWTTRSRSSGGMNKFMGVVCHHTASKTTPANDLNYMVNGSDSAPVSNGLLDRTGHFTCIGAGATNHAGKGGGSSGGGGAPWVTSKGTVPADSANSNTFGIEAANDGVGEPWPAAQQDAYIKMCAALCDAYGLIPELDCISHHLWTPGRKIDPRGPSRWQPANAGMPWDFPRFRTDVTAAMGGATPVPPADEGDMMLTIFTVHGAGAAFLGFTWHGLGQTVEWLDTEAKLNTYRAQNCDELTIQLTDCQNLWLLGRVPHGDARHNWIPSDFRGVIAA